MGVRTKREYAIERERGRLGDTSWKWGTSWKWVPTFGRNFLEVYDRGVAHTSGKG